MATLPVNNIKRSVAPKTLFPSAKVLLDSSVSFNQGDLLALVGGKLKAIALDADTTYFLGVAKVTVVDGKLKSPYQGTAVDAALAVSDVPGPEYGVVVELKLHLGDAFSPGDLVYPLGTDDAQTITSSSNAGARKPCGIFQGPTVAAAAAGEKGLVMLGQPITAGSLDF